MPKVTEAHRQARRDEIAGAAIRVLAQHGVSNTSIAQIVTESGLSAGAIYANFENKAELARYIARRLFDWRLDLITALPEDGRVRAPVDVLRTLLLTTEEERPPIEVLLQFWAEATMDPDLHAVLSATLSGLREAFETAVLPWAERRDPAHAAALARRTAVTMVVLGQGYLTNTGLLGWTTPEEFLASAAEMFSAD